MLKFISHNIFSILSKSGHQVYPGKNHFYAGTKFAVRALLEGLRQELQADHSGIRVSVIRTIFLVDILY